MTFLGKNTSQRLKNNYGGHPKQLIRCAPSPSCPLPPEFFAFMANWLHRARNVAAIASSSVSSTTQSLVRRSSLCPSPLYLPFWTDRAWPAQLSADLLAHLLQRNVQSPGAGSSGSGQHDDEQTLTTASDSIIGDLYLQAIPPAK